LLYTIRYTRRPETRANIDCWLPAVGTIRTDPSPSENPRQSLFFGVAGLCQAPYFLLHFYTKTL